MKSSHSESPGLSLVIPVYRNEESIGELLEVLSGFHARYGDRFEAILVVDGSPDDCWSLLRSGLRQRAIPSQVLLLSRNFGSFAAIRAGLGVARFEISAVMSADLQEPPELIHDLYLALATRKAELAVGVRSNREDGLLRNALSTLYWRLYRRWVMPSVPRGGVDVFACGAEVRVVLLALSEPNSSLIAQLFWVGFRRVEIPYERVKRAHGRSAWTLKRRFRYMLDSVFGFSDLPIMVLLWIGFIGVVASFIGGIVVLASWWSGGITVPGYTPVILGVLFIGSLLLMGQGIVGAYVWRTAENTKQRPLSIVASHEIIEQGSG